ncbi:putative nucleoside diphosphatase [Elsinoe ampelina]|uniref:Putative nucleoside diphosphatase n=1 Tax=Elsinoe ampelina TaxID=302913 RepID=A0A6A6GND8_9PEZI|nr:putative nucleoside diphosphatase [Elsinoe ampelina]
MGKWRYGVILDAGSSGTRAYVYRWLKPEKARKKASKEELGKLPELRTKKKWAKKIHPGLSTFGDKPEQVGTEHLKELMDHALKIVPSDEHENTPIFLLATAGMRLLPDQQRKDVLANVCSYMRRTTKFQLPDCDMHIQVIPGETEGLYGWLAANYLLGGFDDPSDHAHGKEHHTYGFLDMGGASAQIAFAPNATEAEKHANDLTLLRLRTIGGHQKEYRVFVTTWLEYGVNEARRRYLKALLDSSPDSKELPDPCLPIGLRETKSGHVVSDGSKDVKGEPSLLLGTGKFDECLRQTFPLLDKDAACADEPCLLHGVHVPAIDFDVNHFVGVSEYWHTTHSVFEMGHKDMAYDFKTHQSKVNEFCSKDWKSIKSGVSSQKWGKKVDETTAAEVCFKASWLINMLHEGIGVPRVGLEQSPDSDTKAGNKTKQALESAKDRGFLDPFQAVDKIDGTEVSWTLGKMVLYAASQHPPEDHAMAVGFGSNIPGKKLPADFQFPGGREPELPDDLDWHDKLFASAGERRVPGLLLFGAILIVALFLLCGRERRQNILSKFRPSSPPRFSRKKRGVLSRFFGKGAKYAPLAPTGTDDFELGDVDSDSDLEADKAPTKSTRASGWSTPKLQGALDSPVIAPNSAKTYFDYPAGPGLTSRTESRERLGLTPGLSLNTSGSRSRHNSPTRRASPLGAPKDLD